MREKERERGTPDEQKPIDCKWETRGTRQFPLTVYLGYLNSAGHRKAITDHYRLWPLLWKSFEAVNGKGDGPPADKRDPTDNGVGSRCCNPCGRQSICRLRTSSTAGRTSNARPDSMHCSKPAYETRNLSGIAVFPLRTVRFRNSTSH